MTTDVPRLIRSRMSGPEAGIINAFKSMFLCLSNSLLQVQLVGKSGDQQSQQGSSSVDTVNAL